MLSAALVTPENSYCSHSAQSNYEVLISLKRAYADIALLTHDNTTLKWKRYCNWLTLCYSIWGCVFSVYPFPLWWSREYPLCLIIIKSEVWAIFHCSGLGHETMVYAVCLSIFLCCCSGQAFDCLRLIAKGPYNICEKKNKSFILCIGNNVPMDANELR